jgi:hypothetical protein
VVVCLQWCCLLLCLGSIWVSDGVSSAWVLMAGVAASRLGLWMFDLAVMQLMQDNVRDSDRCVVGGVQNSLQSIFDLLTYIMGIIISDPRVLPRSSSFSSVVAQSRAEFTMVDICNVCNQTGFQQADDDVLLRGDLRGPNLLDARVPREAEGRFLNAAIPQPYRRPSLIQRTWVFQDW